MSIRQMVETKAWNFETDEWIPIAPMTSAKAVETSDGSNVQDKLDAISSLATEANDSVITELRAGVEESGNTLAKLYSLISSLQSLVSSDDVNLDTVQEIVTYIKANNDDLTLIGTNKVNYADVVNALTTISTVEGKVLDARQGKVIKDLIDVLTTDIATLQDQSQNFITGTKLYQELQSMAIKTRPIVSPIPPLSPVHGQLWLKPVGTIVL